MVITIKPKGCTEWRPRCAAGEFGSPEGAAIGELVVGRPANMT